MLMIRLQRVGRKNDPNFRVVLTDKRNSTKSRNFKEILGNYDVKGGKTSFNNDRVLYWMKMGAKLSPTMHNLLVSEKIISGKKINVLPRKSPIKSAPTEAKGEEGEKQSAPAEISEVAASDSDNAETKEKEKESQETPGESSSAKEETQSV